MARVTVEDCMKQEGVNDRYELVALASKRAKDIGAGGVITIDNDNEKNAVIALREIAAGKIDVEQLKEIIIESQMKTHKSRHGDDDVVLDDDDDLKVEIIDEMSSNYQVIENDEDLDFKDDEYIGEDILDIDEDEE
jgi:DNA-directed RNA polymerase subunit omega